MHAGASQANPVGAPWLGSFHLGGRSRIRTGRACNSMRFPFGPSQDGISPRSLKACASLLAVCGGIVHFTPTRLHVLSMLHGLPVPHLPFFSGKSRSFPPLPETGEWPHPPGEESIANGLARAPRCCTARIPLVVHGCSCARCSPAAPLAISPVRGIPMP